LKPLDGLTFGYAQINRVRKPFKTMTTQKLLTYSVPAIGPEQQRTGLATTKQPAADFATIETPDGHYNRGNALAVAGNYEQAIAAYEITLNAEPEHEEALQNKAIVEQLLEQENQESAEQDSGENENSESQQNSEDESEQQDENSDQQDQESQEGNQDQQQQEQQSEAPDEQEASESNSEQNTPSDTTNEEFEEQQALEQWLRRIDDDPGELLRRKFRYQYRQRQA
jgi:Ca-activated chloride channel family protein